MNFGVCHPHSQLLHEYLLATHNDGGTVYGCRTQIRLEYLKADGFHVKPQYDPVIDKTYACAVMGINVPCPTPPDEFMPEHIRQQWRKDWPEVGRMGDSSGRFEGPRWNYGWRR